MYKKLIKKLRYRIKLIYHCFLIKENSTMRHIFTSVLLLGGLEYYRNPNGTKSLDVETAAYAVLANLELNNSKSAVVPLVRYLSTNLNPSGGFYSTQVNILPS